MSELDLQSEADKIDLEIGEVIDLADSYRITSLQFMTETRSLRFRTNEQPFSDREVSELLDEEIPETLSELNPLMEKSRTVYEKMMRGGITEEDYVKPPRWVEQGSPYQAAPLAYTEDETLTGDEIKSYYRQALNEAEKMYRAGLENLYHVDDDLGHNIFNTLPLEHDARPENR